MNFLGSLRIQYLLLLLLCEVAYSGSRKSFHKKPSSGSVPGKVSEKISLSELSSGITDCENTAKSLLAFLHDNSEALFSGSSALERQLGELYEASIQAKVAGKKARQSFSTIVWKREETLEGQLADLHIRAELTFREHMHLLKFFTGSARRLQMAASRITARSLTSTYFKAFTHDQVISVLSQIWRDSIAFHQNFGRAGMTARILAWEGGVPALGKEETAREFQNIIKYLESGRTALRRFCDGLQYLIETPYPIPWDVSRLLWELLSVDPLCLTLFTPEFGLRNRRLILEGFNRVSGSEFDDFYLEIYTSNELILASLEQMLDYVFGLLPGLVSRLCSRVLNSNPSDYPQPRGVASETTNDPEPTRYEGRLSIKGAYGFLEWLGDRLSGITAAGEGASIEERFVETLYETTKHNDGILANLSEILHSYRELSPEQQMQARAYVEYNRRRLLFLEEFAYMAVWYFKRLSWEDPIRHQLSKCLIGFGSRLTTICCQLRIFEPLFLPSHPAQSNERNGGEYHDDALGGEEDHDSDLDGEEYWSDDSDGEEHQSDNFDGEEWQGENCDMI